MKKETKQCKNCAKDFTIESDDFDFYEKVKVPPPTFCPECRMIRRFQLRNERTWHRRVCDATGKPLLSMFASDVPYKVYELNYWKSDAWDPMEYGHVYDSSRSFFAQFDELMRAVPHANLIQKNNANSDYSNATLNAKNCYYCSSLDTGEDCSYCFTGNIRIKNCLDLHQSIDDEFSYELVDCLKCNRLLFGQNCEGCVDSMFLYDCRNCTNCFGCVGLRNKQYCIWNEQHSREDYLEQMKQLRAGSYQTLLAAKEKFEELKLRVPRKFAVIQKAENVSGDDILNARNCHQCFVVRNSVENLKYCYRVWENSKDIWDGFVAWRGSEMMYEVVSCTGQRIYFSAYIWGGNDIFYSYNCFDCNNIFGCVGLRSKSYCIFNTQYSKEEYEVLIAQIIEKMKIDGEYGEFFPASISPFAYNETVAQDYFPKIKDDAQASGYRWRDAEEKNYNVTMKSEAIPDGIAEASDDILKEVIECAHQGVCSEQCATAFRLTSDELVFYRTMKLPLPRLCPSCRHYGRVKLKNPLRLWNRTCTCERDTHTHSGPCSNTFQTPYSPERSEMIYCEECYNAEIV